MSCKRCVFIAYIHTSFIHVALMIYQKKKITRRAQHFYTAYQASRAQPVRCSTYNLTNMYQYVHTTAVKRMDFAQSGRSAPLICGA